MHSGMSTHTINKYTNIWSMRIIKTRITAPDRRDGPGNAKGHSKVQTNEYYVSYSDSMPQNQGGHLMEW